MKPSTFIVRPLNRPPSKFYNATVNSKYAEEWASATIEERESIVENGTWDELPESEISIDQKALDGKCVFRLKHGVDGEIIRSKAR